MSGLASFFRNYGVDKFRLTGGEPTLRSDLGDVVSGLHALGPRQIGMTTNGVALAKKIPNLVAQGLDSLNVSLDTLHPTKFENKILIRTYDDTWPTLRHETKED